MRQSKSILFLMMLTITFQMQASFLDTCKQVTFNFFTDFYKNHIYKNPVPMLFVGAACLLGLHQYKMHRMIIKLHTENSELKSKVETLENKPASMIEAAMINNIETTVNKKITNALEEPLKQLAGVRTDINSTNGAITKLITAEEVDKKITDQIKLLPVAQPSITVAEVAIIVDEKIKIPLDKIGELRTDVNVANDTIKKLMTAEIDDKKIEGQVDSTLKMTTEDIELIHKNIKYLNEKIDTFDLMKVAKDTHLLEEKTTLITEDVVEQKIAEGLQTMLDELIKLTDNMKLANKYIDDLSEEVAKNERGQIEEFAALRNSMSSINNDIKILSDKVTLFETIKPVEKDAPSIEGQVNEISSVFDYQKKHVELNKKIEDQASEIEILNEYFSGFVLGYKSDIEEINKKIKQFLTFKEGPCKNYVEEIQVFVNSLKTKYDEGINKQFSDIAIRLDDLQGQLKVRSETIKPIKRVSIDESQLPKFKQITDSPIHDSEPDESTITTPVYEIGKLDSIGSSTDSTKIKSGVNAIYEFELGEINNEQKQISKSLRRDVGNVGMLPTLSIEDIVSIGSNNPSDDGSETKQELEFY